MGKVLLLSGLKIYWSSCWRYVVESFQQGYCSIYYIVRSLCVQRSVLCYRSHLFNNDYPLDNLQFPSYIDSNPHCSKFLAPCSWFTDASHYICCVCIEDEYTVTDLEIRESPQIWRNDFWAWLADFEAENHTQKSLLICVNSDISRPLKMNIFFFFNIFF